jgi:hypothetical protein
MQRAVAVEARLRVRASDEEAGSADLDAVGTPNRDDVAQTTVVQIAARCGLLRFRRSAAS